jgi:hypothetical protein
MLRDVAAAFLNTVTEREFDAPLLALLGARGFHDVHFLHGGFEFGKDFVAKGLKPPDGVELIGACWFMLCRDRPFVLDYPSARQRG